MWIQMPLKWKTWLISLASFCCCRRFTNELFGNTIYTHTSYIIQKFIIFGEWKRKKKKNSSSEWWVVVFQKGHTIGYIRLGRHALNTYIVGITYSYYYYCMYNKRIYYFNYKNEMCKLMCKYHSCDVYILLLKYTHICDHICENIIHKIISKHYFVIE